jgi:hypothetical protein
MTSKKQLNRECGMSRRLMERIGESNRKGAGRK